MLVLMTASYIVVNMKIWIRALYAMHVGIRSLEMIQSTLTGQYQEEGACKGDVVFSFNTTSETFVHEQNECKIDAMAQRRT